MTPEIVDFIYLMPKMETVIGIRSISCAVLRQSAVTYPHKNKLDVLSLTSSGGVIKQNFRTYRSD